ncbi:MAG: enoyl-CoA hydratase [Hyphomicrobiaceae bacterium]|jgi:enoyl-CoA hydratase
MSDAIAKRVAGRVVELRLNRPAAGNGFDLAMVNALLDALDGIDAEACDTIVFRGEGKGFCGGLDLSEMASESDATLLYRLVRIEQLLQKVASMPQETVALGHRFAFGAGADLFAACRQRIAAPGTKFAFPGVRFGIALGTGRLARRVGPDAARRMLAATAPITMEHALETGLVQTEAAVEDWPACVAEMETATSSLDARMAQVVAERLDPGKDDEDMAALVRTGAEPGLKDRIANYAAAVAAARKK